MLRNLAKFLISCFAKFSSNVAKFKIILWKFCVSRNFDKIILNFAKFEENFAKLEIKNFANISRNYENKNFAATLCNSGVRARGGWRASRYSPGAPSALMQIVHYSSSYVTVFHSVIFNSVLKMLSTQFNIDCVRLQRFYPLKWFSVFGLASWQLPRGRGKR